MSTKPSVFIGSSREGLEVARALQFQLQDDADVTLWNEGLFGLSQGTLESLVDALERFDFAILVLTGDDMIVSRDISLLSARDNVLIELGLFMGRIGRTRTYVVCGSHEKLKIPSDLAGVTLATYQPNKDDDLITALGPASTFIRRSMKKLGPFAGMTIKQSSLLSNAEVYFNIINKESSKCLEIADWGIEDGERIQQWDYHGGDNQTWGLRPVDERYFYFTSKHTGKCLDVTDSSSENGARIQQWKYTGADNQHWLFNRLEDGAYQISAKHCGKCLEIESGSHDNGVPVLQARWHGGNSQRWWIRFIL